MSETPSKTVSLDDDYKSFSPITIRESPASVSPQKNLTGLPRVARDIAADVYNNIQKWNDNHIAGANLVKSIGVVKSESSEIYPAGLEPLTKDLFKVVQNLKGVSGALEFLTSQMNALVKLNKQDSPLFISLSVIELTQLVQDISDAYKAELALKEDICENIAHSEHQEETMFYAACWTHQQNINNSVILKLETLLTETGHRKIT